VLLRAGTIKDATGPLLTFAIDSLRQVEVKQHAIELRCFVYSFKRRKNKFVICLLFQCISAGEDVM